MIKFAVVVVAFVLLWLCGCAPPQRNVAVLGWQSVLAGTWRRKVDL
jgi:hypothetical protein